MINQQLASEKQCAIPPAGWRCTRVAGHDGPCAAIAVSDGPGCHECKGVGVVGWGLPAEAVPCPRCRPSEYKSATSELVRRNGFGHVKDGGRTTAASQGEMYRFRGRLAEIQDREGTHGNWLICPSTHCDRAKECRSPHECSGRGRHDQGPIEAELLGGITVHIAMTPTPLSEVLPLMTDDWLDAHATPVMVSGLRDAVETLLIRLRRIASAAGHHDPAEGCRVILDICREGT